MHRRCGMLPVVLVIAALSWDASATAYELHALDGQPVPLKQCDSVVTVQFDHDVTPGELENLMGQEADLADHYPAFHLGRRFWTLGVEGGRNIDGVISHLRRIPTVMAVNPTFQGVSGVSYVTDELLVCFSEDVPLALIDSVHASLSSTVVHARARNQRRQLIRVSGPPERTTLDVGDMYYQSGLCSWVQPNFISRLGLDREDAFSPEEEAPVPDDPLFRDQWHFKNTRQSGGNLDADIDADWAWTITKGNPAVTVVVIDAAFWFTHVDLDLLTTPIDGYDVVGQFIEEPVEDNDPRTKCFNTLLHCWHGTAILGELGAGSANHIGVSGLAPRCSFYCVKAYDEVERWTNSALFVNALRKAWLPPVSAKIISCSTPAPVSSYIESELWTMNANGVAPFFAVGNSGVVEFPANADSVYGVGATDRPVLSTNRIE